MTRGAKYRVPKQVCKVLIEKKIPYLVGDLKVVGCGLLLSPIGLFMFSSTVD